MNIKYRSEDIVVVGERLFRKNGYHNTGVSDILNEAEIPKGSFYNFFGSKEGFAIEVIKFYGEYMLEYMNEYFSDRSFSPINRLKNFYSFTIEANRIEGLKNGCLINNLGSEIGGIDASLRTASNNMFERWLMKISEVINEGQEIGEIREDVPSYELAEFVHTGFMGSLSRMKLTKSDEPLKRTFKMNFEYLEN